MVLVFLDFFRVFEVFRGFLAGFFLSSLVGFLGEGLVEFLEEGLAGFLDLGFFELDWAGSTFLKN